jgi:predicted metal-dependent enzyme (double-stranded beta helix superfamily)
MFAAEPAMGARWRAPEAVMASKLTTVGAATRVGPLESLIADVDAIRHANSEQRTIARLVAQRLRDLVADGSWLRAEHRQPAEDRYRQHVLYVSPDEGFSVVSLVWRPGQRTAIHDHVAWCVVGVLEGVEREVRFRLYRDGKDSYLTRRFTRIAHAGEAGFIVPPDEDIHQVENAGDSVAISIHVYGANIAKLGSSINRTFDDVPIQARGTGKPEKWRSLS